MATSVHQSTRAKGSVREEETMKTFFCYRLIGLVCTRTAYSVSFLYPVFFKAGRTRGSGEN